MGATGGRCFKVQLPLARQMLLLAGEPDDPVRALDGRDRRPDRRARASATWSRTASTRTRRWRSSPGVAIVIMAIALDRATEAIAERTDPTRRAPDRRCQAPAAACHARDRLGDRAGGRRRLRARRRRVRTSPRTRRTSATGSRRIQSVLDYVEDPSTFVFQQITSSIGNFLVQYGLEPLRQLLRRDALVRDARRAHRDRLPAQRAAAGAVTTLLMLAVIGVVGEWSSAMDTASQVLVATRADDDRRVPARRLGRGERARGQILRPIIDILQTLPQLVYIIPFIYLMPVSIVPGDDRVRALRDPRRDPARGGGDPRRRAGRGGGRERLRRHAHAGAAEGEDPARARRDHARRQPGDHHGARRRRDRRPRRARAASATRSRRGCSGTSSARASSPRSRSSRSASRSTA